MDFKVDVVGAKGKELIMFESENLTFFLPYSIELWMKITMKADYEKLLELEELKKKKKEELQKKKKREQKVPRKKLTRRKIKGED